jgi:hypothetical protein
LIAERVRRDTRDVARLPLVVELEELGVGPHVRRVVGHVDRGVAHQRHLLVARVGDERVEILGEAELDEALERHLVGVMSAPPWPALTSTRSQAGRSLVCWTAAVNLRACIGSTRSSLSAESMSRAGSGLSFGDMMVGRVGVQPGELGGDVGVAVLGDPRAAGAELGVADHVEQGHGADDGADQLGALGHGRADQQAAVGAAVDGEVGASV